MSRVSQHNPDQVGVCPVTHDLLPFDASYLDDPYSVFADLRERGPVHYSPELDMWLVTRYSAIETVLKRPQDYSAAIAQAPVSPLTAEAAQILTAPDGPLPVMSNLDPPDHTRIRKLNMNTFSARRVRVLEDAIRARASELIDALPDGDEVDVVPALTFPLPALTIFTLLGFPGEDAAQLKSWSDNRMYLIWGQLDDDEQARVAQNFRDFFAYCERHVALRKAEPKDDFTSDLLRCQREDPESISDREIASVVFGLSFAGHETTTNLLSNTIRNLVTRPGIWQQLQADRTLIPNAIEEVLRFDSSVICWRRVTTKTLSLEGVDLPEGARLLLLLGSANRDPGKFDDPEAFRLDRADGSRHLSLGKGIHFCLGAPLARLQAQIVVEHLLNRRPEIEVVPDQDLRYPANISFRGPVELKVRAPVARRSTPATT